VEQQKRLRLTGLSAVWSDRTLDEYDNCVSLARQGAEGGVMPCSKPRLRVSRVR
jgi:hypothetical protein